MSEFKKELEEYFKEPEIPPINQATVERLKNQTKNAKPKKNLVMFKRFALAAACVILICTAVLLPIMLQKPLYYSDTETNQQTITQEYAQSLVQENYSKYSFVFEDYYLLEVFGIYSNDKNELLGIRLLGEKYESPFSTLNLCLVINKNFTPKEKEDYLVNSEKEVRDNYVYYYKEKMSDLEDILLYGIMEYSDYCVYVLVNYEDYDSFNKFL
ncbi:MAG: hypothetical protein E7376_02270 [Clostridiales bacterium]|nr:hypothetical protein [Clostridiales bacterium]